MTEKNQLSPQEVYQLGEGIKKLVAEREETLRKCQACPYAQWTAEEDSTEPKLYCDPPMGECPAERS